MQLLLANLQSSKMNLQVWSDSLVNSFKTDDVGEITDFEVKDTLENDFDFILFQRFRSFRLQAFISEYSVNW